MDILYLERKKTLTFDTQYTYTVAFNGKMDNKYENR